MKKTLAVLAGIMAVLLLSPSPAHAALPSGDGWWAQWRYENGGALMHFDGGSPGTEVEGNGWDAVGTRAFIVTVRDTKADGKCAWARFWSNGMNSEHTVCGNGSSYQFTPPSTIWPIFVNVCRNTGSGTAKTNCNYLYIPPSIDDASLRSGGTGMAWHYSSYDPSDPQHSIDGFVFEAKRSGVEVSGWGVHEVSTRQTHASVYGSGGAPFFCASATVNDAQTTVTANACTVPPSIPVQHFVGWISVHGCIAGITLGGVTKRCIGGHVVMPN